MIILRKITAGSLSFVYECLIELRGLAQYTEEDFKEYAVTNGLLDSEVFKILIGNVDNSPVGFLTCNRFAMPRYLGFGYEIEEVVIHPKHQHLGFGSQLISAFLNQVKNDTNIRKVIVKTNDLDRAGHLYSKFFSVSSLKVYSKAINLI